MSPRNTLIRRIGPNQELYRHVASGIAWVRDGSTGMIHTAHPNINHTGSVAGMKRSGAWAKSARTVRANGFVYDIDRVVAFDELDKIALAACSCGGNHGRRPTR